MLREKEALLLENERLLREKDLLFKEIHHRVTNSLQLVHSALSIQLRTLGDSEARGQVAEAAARVLAIAAVHRRLYQGGSAVAADGRHYLRALLDDMKLLMPKSGDRRLDLEMQSFPLSADQLAHLGLIVVELVTNALKHGRGGIKIDVSRDGDALAIAVCDEGPSFPRHSILRRVAASASRSSPRWPARPAPRRSRSIARSRSAGSWCGWRCSPWPMKRGSVRSRAACRTPSRRRGTTAPARR